MSQLSRTEEAAGHEQVGFVAPLDSREAPRPSFGPSYEAMGHGDTLFMPGASHINSCMDFDPDSFGVDIKAATDGWPNPPPLLF